MAHPKKVIKLGNNNSQIESTAISDHIQNDAKELNDIQGDHEVLQVMEDLLKAITTVRKRLSKRLKEEEYMAEDIEKQIKDLD